MRGRRMMGTVIFVYVQDVMIFRSVLLIEDAQPFFETGAAAILQLFNPDDPRTVVQTFNKRAVQRTVARLHPENGT
jgi:hypothetical protein